MGEKPVGKKLTAQDLPKIEELTPDEIKQISGGKSVMPTGVLANYRLLKIADPTYVADVTKTITKP